MSSADDGFKKLLAAEEQAKKVVADARKRKRARESLLKQRSNLEILIFSN
jgi:hypothetical protein